MSSLQGNVVPEVTPTSNETVTGTSEFNVPEGLLEKSLRENADTPGMHKTKSRVTISVFLNPVRFNHVL
jgi:hypothetical protein